MRAFAIAAVCVLAGGLVLAGAPASAAKKKPRRVGSAGVTLTVPASWRTVSAAQAAKWSRVHEPRTRLVTSSGRIAFGSGCNDIDYQVDPQAVTIVVVEWVGPTPGATWASRPGRFTTATIPVRAGGVECYEGLGGSLQFRQAGRRLAAYLLIGSHAHAGVIRKARATLGTLRVGKG
jgi:hypothetical protein